MVPGQIPLEPIPSDSEHPQYTSAIVREERQFMRDLVSLCYIAQKRHRLECDLYGLWDLVWNAFTSRLHKAVNPEVTVAAFSQYWLEYENDMGRKRHKIPDTVVLKLDDTRKKKIIFWAELKSLDMDRWFTEEGKTLASDTIDKTIPQVNTQAQYVLEEFGIETATFKIYAFIISGPYFVLVEYSKDIMSADFFSIAHARQDAAVTRSQAQMNNEDEEDHRLDPGTRPIFPFGKRPQCLFNLPTDIDPEFQFDLDLELEQFQLNPFLLEAFRRIVINQDVRTLMQNITWFDCNY